MCVSLYVCMSVCVCESVSLCVCMSVCVYVCVCESVCVCVHAHARECTRRFVQVSMETGGTKCPGARVKATVNTHGAGPL